MTVDKMIPWIVPIIIFILAQTGAFLWWASSITTSMGYIREQLAAMNSTLADRHTETSETASELHARINVLEERLRLCEQSCAACPGRQKKP